MTSSSMLTKDAWLPKSLMGIVNVLQANSNENQQKCKVHLSYSENGEPFSIAFEDKSVNGYDNWRNYPIDFSDARLKNTRFVEGFRTWISGMIDKTKKEELKEASYYESNDEIDAQKQHQEQQQQVHKKQEEKKPRPQKKAQQSQQQQQQYHRVTGEEERRQDYDEHKPRRTPPKESKEGNEAKETMEEPRREKKPNDNVRQGYRPVDHNAGIEDKEEGKQRKKPPRKEGKETNEGHESNERKPRREKKPKENKERKDEKKLEQRIQQQVDLLYVTPAESYEQARELVLKGMCMRRGHSALRKALIATYHQCAVSGCEVSDLLEVARIAPYIEKGDPLGIDNFVLLSSDIHVLFDRYLLTINPENYRIVLCDSLLAQRWHAEYDGKEIIRPENPSEWPNPVYLRQHMDIALHSHKFTASKGLPPKTGKITVTLTYPQL